MPEIIPGSKIVWGPEAETHREQVRIGRRCTLALIEGTIEVRGKDGEVVVATGPSVVQWWPGDDVVYGSASPDARWMFQQSVSINPPMDLPGPGALVRLSSRTATDVFDGTVVGYAADNATDDAAARFVTIDGVGSGISHIDLHEYRMDVLEAPGAST